MFHGGGPAPGRAFNQRRFPGRLSRRSPAVTPQVVDLPARLRPGSPCLFAEFIQTVCMPTARAPAMSCSGVVAHVHDTVRGNPVRCSAA